jgi:4-diphosphocytidyl-2-C-methyl-D-erythritol kinase
MLAFANAKINIGLNIIEKRSDGFHNLETIFYPIKLNDVIELIDANETSFVGKGIVIPGQEKDNICLKAYYLLQQDYNLPPQQIVLLKNIPIGAGLGGGSADAAFLIKLINQKFNLNLSIAQMQNYASKLGADCAFFIENKPTFACGIGDQFENIDLDLSKYFKVLVQPKVHVSTADAYKGVDVKKPLQSLKSLITLPIQEWKSLILNDFENSVFKQYPEIEFVKNKLYECGAVFALMSGSGSSVFAIFEQPIQLPELEVGNLVFYNI